MSFGVIVALLPTLLTSLVMVAGLVAAFILMQRDRRAAGFALAGFAVLLVGSVINVAWLAYIFTQGLPFDGATPVMLGVNLCQELLSVAGCVLLIIAVRARFSAPGPAATAPSPPPWTVPPTTDAQPGPEAWPAPPVSDPPAAAGPWAPPGQGTDGNSSGSSSGSGMSSSSG